MIRTFESDLETLHHYHLKPVFDETTYPPDIQPLWAKLANLPEDADEALDFWIADGSNDVRVTDAAPRGKWNRLMNARIISFELPSDWIQKSQKATQKQQRTRKSKTKPQPESILSAEDITEARKKLQLSQRTLAEKTEKSQSWIRDIEKGRFQAKPEDQILLRNVLEIAAKSS